METIYAYGINEDSSSPSAVMTEKVQILARNLYQEFHRMIQKYDEDVVKILMPQCVAILESLDLAYTCNQEQEVELELLREDNEQLVTQYEREKQLRKSTETRLLELEDGVEEERKALYSKVESLESIVRMLELKAKNASDHVSRLEDKESEMKRDYQKLHERYTELFKTHVDHVERTKIFLGTDRPEMPGAPSIMAGGRLSRPVAALPIRSSGPLSFGFTSADFSDQKIGTSPQPSGVDFGHVTTPSLYGKIPLGSELSHTQTETELEFSGEEERPPLRSAWVNEACEQNLNVNNEAKSLKRKEERSNNTLYQELSFQEADSEEMGDTTGNWVHPGEYASSDSEPEDTRTNTRGTQKVSDNFYGMGREVENLILENNELLATKNALNIVKDDLIARVDELTSEGEILREEIRSLKAVEQRLKIRLQEMEEEMKRLREETERLQHAQGKSDEEEDVPMAQRKRFNRTEMARVLLERNQYKEKYMELQEAVRWTELLRASRTSPDSLERRPGSRMSFWKFFSGLFSSPERSSAPNRPSSSPLVQYNAAGNQITPGGSNAHNGPPALRKKAEREANRRSADGRLMGHVNRDREDGRLQAYGWSLPSRAPGKAVTVAGSSSASSTNTTTTTVASTASQAQSSTGVPVPVYCRPLLENETSMKLWCAVGIDLSGGQTADGGAVVGGSVFYTAGQTNGTLEENEDHPEMKKIQEEIKASQAEVEELEEPGKDLTSIVWIAMAAQGTSQVVVIDANRPGDILDRFPISTSCVLCMASVPGAKTTDFPPPKDDLTGNGTPATTESGDNEENSRPRSRSSEELPTSDLNRLTFVSCDAQGVTAPKPDSEQELPDVPQGAVLKKEMAQPSSDVPPPASSLDPPGLNRVPTEHLALLPTVWLGCQTGDLYVHSALGPDPPHWRTPLWTRKLPDAILALVHVRGRVLAALANGCVAFFRRSANGTWDASSYFLLELGQPHHSIRCMIRVRSTVWCGYRNRILVLDPETMALQGSFEAHPRKESQVRQMAWTGDGVWISIRLDSSIRLFHAVNWTHLQDVDVEPYVSKMLGTGKLGFSFVRITSMLATCRRLWMGTGNGVIISVPLSEASRTKPVSVKPITSSSAATNKEEGQPLSLELEQQGIIDAYENGPRLYKGPDDKIVVGSFLPYCSMAQAQLSFHGHRDAVKFFVAVPGQGGMSACSSTLNTPCMLVMSGGEGYVDFRLEGSDDDRDGASHLIVWQLTSQTTQKSSTAAATTETTTTTTTNTTTTSTTQPSAAATSRT